MDNLVKRDEAIRLREGGDFFDAGEPFSGRGQAGRFPESREHIIVQKIRGVVDYWGKPGARLKLHSPLISNKEEEYLTECCKNNWLTHGPHVSRLEEHIKNKTKAKFAIVVSSGTAALHLALKTAGVGKGDQVVVPAFTFVATANAVSYCGAEPNFVDCDIYGGLDPVKLDQWLSGNKVKAVVPVHVFGHCCEMDRITEVCKRHGVVLIEDAAQSLGSYYDSLHSGRFGTASALSFNGNKIVTTGGGGAVITDSEEFADRVRLLANVAKKEVPHEYWHVDVGFNYRMPNINAAIGCAQFENIYNITQTKKVLYRRYAEAFKGFDFARILEPGPKRLTNHWLNALILSGVDRKKLVDLLEENGLEPRLCWTPLHFLDMYRDAKRGDLTMTEKLSKSVVNIPSGPGIIT